MIVLQALFLLVAGLLLLPVLLFSVQVLLALPLFGSVFGKRLGRRFRRKTKYALPLAQRPAIAVLVPAHNEGGGIAPTLAAIRAQLYAGDRLLVVADNCADDTAQVAAEAGAEVIERNDSAHRGKGYALDYGVRYLEYAPPDVLIIVDADCEVHDGAIAALAARCLQHQRPVQALYLMRAPRADASGVEERNDAGSQTAGTFSGTGTTARRSAGLRMKIAEFAWAVKNHARALGYARLGLPCQLMGTGMAFPWAMIQQADLASGHIVEDLKLGLDFAAAGCAPRLCTEALVTSVFPANAEGTQSQRTRWEHGHLGMMLQAGPGQLGRALHQRNLGLLALVLDMLVPPLALLTLLVTMFAFIGGAAAWLSGHAMPWLLGPGLLALLGIAVLLAWVSYGRHILRLRDLAYAPCYALAKLPLYVRFVVNRQVEWVRSRRDDRPASGS